MGILVAGEEGGEGEGEEVEVEVEVALGGGEVVAEEEEVVASMDPSNTISCP